MLSIRSFEKNQNLLNLINKTVTHLRLKAHNISDDFSDEELLKAGQVLIHFLNSINNAIMESEGSKILKGVDFRERTFIRKFIDAKRKLRLVLSSAANVCATTTAAVNSQPAMDPIVQGMVNGGSARSLQLRSILNGR